LRTITIKFDFGLGQAIPAGTSLSLSVINCYERFLLSLLFLLLWLLLLLL
jgi:hypothetical protein